MLSTFRFTTAATCLLALIAYAAFFGTAEVSADSRTVSWNDNSGGGAWTRLERREASAAAFARIADVPPGITQYVDDSISFATGYCYRALAYTTDGMSPYSAEACIDGVSAALPTPPTVISFTIAPASVPTGGSVIATWSGIPSPTTTDWIGLYVPGSPDNAYLTWQYVTCSKGAAAPSPAGSCPFTIPDGLPAGAYELRLFAADGYTRLATSGAITVSVPSGPSLRASPSTVAPGGSVTATWSGIPSPTYLDWVGLYTPGSADSAYIAWVYVSCTRTPTVPAATGFCSFGIPSWLTPDTYELRLLANDGYSRLATSSAVTVQ